MQTMTRHFLTAALLFHGMAASACPVCQGWGQPSAAQQLVATTQAVLAIQTSDANRFRVIQVIKGERPADGSVEGGYARARPPDGAMAADAKPLLMVRDEPLPNWVILGGIDTAHADWLRALSAGKPAAEMGPEEWRARVALVVPFLNDSEPLAAELAFSELAAAPYAALRAARPHLDAPELRRCLADPELATHHSLYLLLLGISGDAHDAATLEARLQTAWQSGDTTNLSSMLAADLELQGESSVEWLESHYLADSKRSTHEIKAALLALSVHGNADGAVRRERVIQSYRVFMKAHPEIAGEVASDFAAWRYWDAVPEYLTLMKSTVRQQYPSGLAILEYLRQSPNAGALGFDPSAAPVDGRKGITNLPVPRP